MKGWTLIWIDNELPQSLKVSLFTNEDDNTNLAVFTGKAGHEDVWMMIVMTAIKL